MPIDSKPAPTREVIVALEHPSGLAGHSDGDVLSHAVVDAILGAAGLGDIGSHFPSEDDRWSGAESALFLEHATAAVGSAGYRVSNVDTTVVCSSPRIDVYRDKIEAAIAALVGGAVVSVKATTTDGMGFAGRGEGIAAIAVALLEAP